MKTVLVLVTILYLCFALSGVFSQVAGGAQNAAYFIGATPEVSPQRWISIPQTSEREWERLGSTFTLETWVWMKPPASSADGNWTGAEDEMQFLPIISRHPGGNLQNEWSHFNLQVTRTHHGPVIVFWSGCGCEGPVQMNPEDPTTCGFAYLLASDSEKISPNKRFSLTPGEWHHIAITVDGDSVNAGLTSERARLYVDGEHLLTNEYGSNDNTPDYRDHNPCPGRPLFSQTISGSKNEMVALGWYDNSDTRESSNANAVYGFDGYMDEVRIWGVARSEREIKDNWGSMVGWDNDLVAYYTFNELSAEMEYPNMASHEGIPKAMVKGPMNDDGLGEGSTGLIISQMVLVPGHDHMSMDVEYVDFTLLGNSESGYFINLASDSWAQALDSGIAELLDSYGNSITPDMFPYEVDLGTLSVAFFCDNETGCDNIPGPVHELWIAYSSIENPMIVSQVFFNVQPACIEGYDSCGECGGDNRTCQCVMYHDFRNTRMAYILLTWSLEKIVDKIDRVVQILRDIDYIVEDPQFDDEILVGNYTLAHEVSYMMDFYNLCLTDYCADVTEFIGMLDEYLLSLLPK